MNHNREVHILSGVNVRFRGQRLQFKHQLLIYLKLRTMNQTSRTKNRCLFFQSNNESNSFVFFKKLVMLYMIHRVSYFFYKRIKAPA